jgi:cholesterol transport system auxiliary component
MNKLLLSLFTIITLFSGCISVTKELPPFTTYTISLDHTSTQETSTTKASYSLEITEPKALNSVNSKQISYIKTNHQNETYALNKWSDTPTKILQNMIVQYLNSTDQYSYITSSKLNINTTYKILSELDSFGQIFTNGSSYAKLDIRIYLVDYKTVYTKRFVYQEKCEENNAYGSVKALNKISNLFVQDLHKWIKQQI